MIQNKKTNSFINKAQGNKKIFKLRKIKRKLYKNKFKNLKNKILRIRLKQKSLKKNYKFNTMKHKKQCK